MTPFVISDGFEFNRAMRAASNIIVTGPTRSGTKLIALVISNDLNMVYANESEVRYNDFEKMEEFLNVRRGYVLQCPSYIWAAAILDRPETCTVMAMRPMADILKSRERMYHPDGTKVDPFKAGVDTAGQVVQKHMLWEYLNKKDRISAPFEVHYTSLQSHPLFIPDEVRRSMGTKWLANQTN